MLLHILLGSIGVIWDCIIFIWSFYVVGIPVDDAILALATFA